MRKGMKVFFLIAIPIWSICGYLLYDNTVSLIELHAGIIEDLNIPYDDPLLGKYNHGLTCHKVGLYTDWDESWHGAQSKYITGIDVAEHARKMFFEYNCNLECNKYWESNKICLAELYPHE